MKTKIIMMTALLALLATGCGKDMTDGRIRIFAENMTAAGGSKLQIDPSAPVNGEQWLNGETIKLNSATLTITGNNNDGYSVDPGSTALSGGAYYALYPGGSFNGNTVTVNNGTVAAPTITLTTLAVNFHDGVHDVVFPMGAKVDESSVASGLQFKHLTAGFRLTLHATTSVTLTKLKVIVYGSAAAAPVTDAVTGVSYTVAWANQGNGIPLPNGEVGGLSDLDVAFGSVMNFDLKTSGSAGVTFTGNKQLCIPVTLATVRYITVIGYNGEDQVFVKSSKLDPGVELERNVIYPVAAIPVN